MTTVETILNAWRGIFGNSQKSIYDTVNPAYVVIDSGIVGHWAARAPRNRTGIRIKWNRGVNGWYCTAEGFELMYYKELSHLLEDLDWHAKASGIRVKTERWPYSAHYWYITRSRGVEPRPQPSRETAE